VISVTGRLRRGVNELASQTSHQQKIDYGLALFILSGLGGMVSRVRASAYTFEPARGLAKTSGK